MADLVVQHSLDVLHMKTQVCKHTDEHLPLCTVFWLACNICLVGDCLWAVLAFSIWHALCPPCLQARYTVTCASNLMQTWPSLVKAIAGLTQRLCESKACELQQPIYPRTKPHRLAKTSPHGHHMRFCSERAKQAVQVTCFSYTFQPPRSVEVKF